MFWVSGRQGPRPEEITKMLAIMYTTADSAEIILAADAIEAADLVAIIEADGGAALIMPYVADVVVVA